MEFGPKNGQIPSSFETSHTSSNICHCLFESANIITCLTNQTIWALGPVNAGWPSVIEKAWIFYFFFKVRENSEKLFLNVATLKSSV